MRLRTFWPAAAIASAMLAAAASCSSFTEEEGPTTPNEAGAEGSDAPPIDMPDGGDAGEGRLRLPCPPAKAGTAQPTAWVKRTLFAPPVGGQRMYPFVIATDSSHVTWLAQLGTVPTGGSDRDPYNGNGKTVVMRARKDGTGQATLLADDQESATALVLDGTSVYWATHDSGTSTLRTQSRDFTCGSPCQAPTTLLKFKIGERIIRLVRPAPGVLFALAENGKVYRIQIGSGAGLVLSTANLPAITATDKQVYASALEDNRVQMVPIGIPMPPISSSVLPREGGAGVGVAPIATDCTTLWMSREYSNGKHILGAPLAALGTPSKLAEVGDLVVFDIAADARFVYVAAANAGGVFAIDKLSQISEQPYEGNVFRLAVDDDGVYFGEHAVDKSPGSITMLVKK